MNKLRFLLLLLVCAGGVYAQDTNLAGSAGGGAATGANSDITSLTGLTGAITTPTRIALKRSGASGSIPSFAGIVPGVTGTPFLSFLTDSGVDTNWITLGGAVNGGVSTGLISFGAGGTNASPTNNWTGGIGDIYSIGYVGGAVAAWRGFTSIEYGNAGANPAAEADVVGKIQFNVADVGTSDFSSRTGFAIEPTGLGLTNGIPIYAYNTGWAHTYSGSPAVPAADYERLAIRWIGGTSAVIGTEKAGTGNARRFQTEFGGTAITQVDGNGFYVAGDYVYGFSSGTAPAAGTSLGTSGVRWYQPSAGIVRYDDGSGAAIAKMEGIGRTVSAKTTNYTVTALNSNQVFTNTGASGTVNFTLPTAALGVTYTFSIEAAQTLTVTAAGTDTIRLQATESGAAGNISAATVGNVITIVCTRAGKWVVISHEGTWTVT